MRTLAKAPEWALGKAPVPVLIGGHMWVSLGALNEEVRIKISTGVVESSPISVSNAPQAVAWDGGDYMYVAESASHFVQRVSVPTLTAGSSVDLGVGNAPAALVQDGTYMYVLSNGANPVLTRVLIATGVIDGVPTSFSSIFGSCKSLTCDGSTVYVSTNSTDPAVPRILKGPVGSWGSFSTQQVLGNPLPQFAAWDGGGRAYVAASGQSDVFRIDVATGLVDLVISTGTGTFPTGIAWDGGSYIYVVDNLNTVVRILISSGAVAGAPIAVDPNPFYIAWDHANHMYVVHQTGNRITRILVSTGQVDPVNGIISLPDSPQIIAWNGGAYMYATGGFRIWQIRISDGVLTNTYLFGSSLSGIAWDGGAFMWIVDLSSRRVSQMVVAGGTPVLVTAFGALGSNPYFIAWDGGLYMWVTNPADRRIYRILISSGAVSGPVSVGNQPIGLALDGSGNMYVPIQQEAAVSIMSVSSGLVTSTTKLFSTLDGIAWDGATHLYVVNTIANQVLRVLISGGLGIGISVGSAPKNVAWDGGLWMYVTNSGDDTVSRILISSGAVDATISVGSQPDEVAWDGGLYMYVNNKGDNTVSRILISSGAVDATISVADVPGGIAWDGPLR